MNFDLDRRAVFAGLGGAAVVATMTAEAKADALEDYLMQQLDAAAAGKGGGGGAVKKFPTAAEIEAQIETRSYRRGVGGVFISPRGNVKKLAPLPEQPTLVDYFKLRFTNTANHCFQSANRAMKNGQPEEIVMACLLHDTVQELIKVDHGWWGAQLYEPYVSERVAFAIRYHQALRFYDDAAVGYSMPDLYRNMFGEDYKPEPYIRNTYETIKKHKWYDLPRQVTVNDLYAFDPNVKVGLDQFLDVIGRQFKQPKEGLGYDNSPVAHMWRSLSMPDHPL